jgi:hypothetical protein
MYPIRYRADRPSRNISSAAYTEMVIENIFERELETSAM